MAFIKLLFLLLLLLPFAIFLLFIIDKLMDEAPKKSRAEMEAEKEEYMRSKAAGKGAMESAAAKLKRNGKHKSRNGKRKSKRRKTRNLNHE